MKHFESIYFFHFYTAKCGVVSNTLQAIKEDFFANL